MPDFFTFLFKVNVSLILFCLAYYLILRQLTFYTLNRVFLLGGIFFSSLYPLLDFSFFFRHTEAIVIPVSRKVVYQVAAEVPAVDYWFLAELVFWAGLTIMSVRMLIHLYSLYKVHNSSIPAEVQKYQVRLLENNMGTFSFWKQIYLNPSKHHPEELVAVLEHEKVHVKELHTLDILLAELATIFYWFNPGVWLIRKAIKENVEFITDQTILKKGVDRKSYQYSMLHAGIGLQPSVLMNNFNLTAIKRRIVMMNSRRSSSFQLLRYVFLLPLLLFLVTAFTIVRTKTGQGLKENKKTYTGIMPAAPLRQPVRDRLPEKRKKARRKPVPVMEVMKQDSSQSIRLISIAGSASEDTMVHKRTIHMIVRESSSPENEAMEPKTGLIFLKMNNKGNQTEAVSGMTGMENARTFINDKEVPAGQLKEINPGMISRINVIKNKNNSQKTGIYMYTKDFKN